MNDPSSRIMRFKLKLHESEYVVVYKKGKENSNSNGLSRMYTVAKGTIAGEDVEEDHKVVTAEYPGEVESEDKDRSKRVTEEVLEDDNKRVAESKLREIKRNKVSDKNVEIVSERDREAEGTNENADNSDVECRKLSDKEKLGILREMHESPIGGHIGMNRTYQRLKQYINWEGMKKDIEKFIRKCEKCQKNKLTQRHTGMPLMLTDTPSVVFEKCNVDIVCPLSTSESGNSNILTVQDDLSKFLIAVPMRGQTTQEVSKAFVENVILVYGLPQIVLSDCGANFLSDTFMGIWK
jgi:hypothetical protein